MIFSRGRTIVARIRDAMITLAVTAVIFVAVEVGIRVFAPQETVNEFADGKSLAVEDEVLGHVYRPNSRATVRTPEFTVKFEINRDGIRDESNHPEPKPPGITRILLLGDSFTFGDANEYDKIWPVVFERELLSRGYDVDVVKAGVSGYDTRTELLYLERLYPRYEPDYVVLTFLPNDIVTNTPLAADLPADASPVRVVRAGNEKRTTLHLLTFAKRLLLPSDRMYVKLYLLTPRAEYFTLPMSDRVKRQMETTKELLKAANDYCRERNVQFIVLSLPQLFQVLTVAKDYGGSGIDPGFIDSVMGEFAGGNEFAWIPLLPALADVYRAGGADLYFRFDGHLNNRGNEVTGKLFADRFLELCGDEIKPNNRTGG